MVDGERDAKARFVAIDYRDPDFGEGMAETPACVGLRFAQLQVLSPSALGKLKSWGLGIRHACLKAGNFNREVFVSAPLEWVHKGPSACGDCGILRMAQTMPRRPFLKPLTGTFGGKGISLRSLACFFRCGTWLRVYSLCFAHLVAQWGL